jgi:hypothetical protein
MTRRFVASALAAVCVLLTGARPGAAAEPPKTAEPVPPAWIAYAQDVTRSLTAWLSSAEEPAPRLRAYLNKMRQAGQPVPTLRVKVWIDEHGVISRIDFPPFVHEQANDDLRALLVQRTLPAAPPKDLRQPLRLELQLQDPTST